MAKIEDETGMDTQMHECAEPTNMQDGDLVELTSTHDVLEARILSDMVTMAEQDTTS